MIWCWEMICYICVTLQEFHLIFLHNMLYLFIEYETEEVQRLMRKIRIPQKPDRPDIDDLIFGDEHETQSDK